MIPGLGPLCGGPARFVCEMLHLAGDTREGVAFGAEL